MTETPGQAAYTKFIELSEWTQHYVYYHWENLPDTGKAAWEDIARAAVHQWEQRSEGDTWSPYD